MSSLLLAGLLYEQHDSGLVTVLMDAREEKC
jgi:hypothetical protein